MFTEQYATFYNILQIRFAFYALDWAGSSHHGIASVTDRTSDQTPLVRRGFKTLFLFVVRIMSCPFRDTSDFMCATLVVQYVLEFCLSLTPFLNCTHLRKMAMFIFYFFTSYFFQFSIVFLKMLLMLALCPAPKPFYPFYPLPFAPSPALISSYLDSHYLPTSSVLASFIFYSVFTLVFNFLLPGIPSQLFTFNISILH